MVGKKAAWRAGPAEINPKRRLDLGQHWPAQLRWTVRVPMLPPKWSKPPQLSRTSGQHRTNFGRSRPKLAGIDPRCVTSDGSSADFDQHEARCADMGRFRPGSARCLPRLARQRAARGGVFQKWPELGKGMRLTPRELVSQASMLNGRQAPGSCSLRCASLCRASRRGVLQEVNPGVVHGRLKARSGSS